MKATRACAIPARAGWSVVMIANPRHALQSPALRALLLRGGLVGAHMAVLAGLAFVRGLDGFGALIVLWGLALVAANVLGFGAPLVLLARLADGRGMRPAGLILVCLGLPVAAGLLALWLLAALWPDVDWSAVLALALAIHLVSCLGSLLRTLGSLHLSVLLRDAAPVLALGLAGLLPVDTSAVLWLTAALLGAASVPALWLCLQLNGLHALIGRHRPADIWHPALWGSAVLGMVLAQIDILVGGYLLTPEQIGIYALLRRLANLVALPVSVATWFSAGPVSAAHAARDGPALQQAAQAGARLALLPGVMLALLMLPLAVWFLPQPDLPVLAVLTGGALVQLVFAQGITVASLTGSGDLAAKARLAGVLLYLALAGLALPLDPLGNALAYVAGTGLCGALLWAWLWRGNGVNTLALQWRRRRWQMP